MRIFPAIDPVRTQRMNTAELREAFLLESLFQSDAVILVYSENDRAVIGSAIPVQQKLELASAKELAANYFAERREIGVLNIGGSGQVVVDAKTFDLANRDMLYIGRGAKEIIFSSENGSTPAGFFS